MTRRRYTMAGMGATVPLSFRVSVSADALLKDRVANLVAAGEIKNQSEALQDALVVWLMIEEHQEMIRAGQVSASGVPGVPLEEIVDGQGRV